MEITDEQIRQEAAECYARKIRQAQQMSPFEKFMAGAELFEDACQITLAGIQNQYQNWTEDECRIELIRRINSTEAIL
jgi:hypothetical protein